MNHPAEAAGYLNKYFDAHITASQGELCPQRLDDNSSNSIQDKNSAAHSKEQYS
jgi:hypothetical protein